MRSIGLAILGVVVSMALCVSVALCEEVDQLCIPMNTLELKPLAGAEQHRSSVAFPHSAHFGYRCQRCHHTWKGTGEIQNCTTSGCHDQLSTPKNADGKIPASQVAVKYYKKAYHQLCIDCHKQIKVKNKALELSQKKLTKGLAKTGPTGCVGCHPKDGSSE
jgi:hypothetical protein